VICNVICFSFRLGLFTTYILETEIPKYKKRSIHILFKQAAKLSLKQQMEFFRFLSLYYVEGQNTYYLVQIYAKSILGPKKRLYKKILSLMKQGDSFFEILNNNRMCSADLSMILSLADQIGNLDQVFTNSNEFISDKIKEQNLLRSKIAYPVVLILMVMVLLVFVSTVLVPQFKGFYEIYNVATPILIKLLETRWLFLYGVILLISIFLIKISAKYINKKYLLKLPFVSKGIKLKFQNMLFRILKYAKVYGVPTNLLLDRMIDVERNDLHKFYLSTLSIQLKQGKEISETLKLPIIEERFQRLLAFAHGQQKESEILEKMIIENKESYEAYYRTIIGIASFLAMLFSGLLVFVIGYLMMSPLQNISNIL